MRIPRTTCRLFGAMKAVSTLKNTVVLVHGPKGCVYHINYILGMRGDRPSKIYSTCLEEHDVVFGAEEKLVDAISQLDRELSPDLILVFSCCATNIIGEDVEGALRASSARARVIGIETGGFEGDHTSGYGETLRRLAMDLSIPGIHVEPCTVNLIGMLRAGPDLREITSILEEAGVHVNTVLTANASLGDLERLGRAELNVVICETSGKAAAEALEQKFGTPYLIAEIPIGPDSTDNFLSLILKSLDMPDLPKKSPHIKIDNYKGRIRRNIAVVSGPTRAVAMTRFLKELGIMPRMIVLDFDTCASDKISEICGDECLILIHPEQEEILEKLRELEIDLLIGGMMERPLAACLGIDHVDMMHGSQKTVGDKGTGNLLAAIMRDQKKCSNGNTRKDE